ncbi:MAG TPA: DUF951 domain-containing protein [Tepidiformaceae bacterium]|nr:DUF951 domain-containing protein [Tepidiformaceae bacterium]
MILEINEGEVYRMRRQHPCGGWRWKVIRTGADVGMECLTCGRRVMVERRKFESRVKTLVEKHD